VGAIFEFVVGKFYGVRKPHIAFMK
jgi:hypothetical protein